MAMQSSRKPYHMATTWMVPSWLCVASDIVRRRAGTRRSRPRSCGWRLADSLHSISSWVVTGALAWLGGDRTIRPRQRVERWTQVLRDPTTGRPGRGDDLLGGVPRLAVVEAAGQRCQSGRAARVPPRRRPHRMHAWCPTAAAARAPDRVDEAGRLRARLASSSTSVLAATAAASPDSGTRSASNSARAAGHESVTPLP